MSESPAKTMRRAAALMRERAQAVQHFTSPWHTAGPVKNDEWRDQNDEWRVMYATDHPAAGLIATTADYGTYCLPDHIASWHPLVALAVAEWLEAEAISYDELERTPYGAEGAAFVAGDFGGDVDPALKLARRYLGEEAA